MQEEILELLEKYKKPMSRTEIAEALSASLDIITHNLTRLINGHDVKIIEITADQAIKRTNNFCKRRMRLYYVN